jgi:glycosyltransferase involved in cell wall biosynthesis
MLRRRKRSVRVAHVHSATGVYGAERWTLTVLRHHDTRKVDASLVTIGSGDGAKKLAALGEGLGLSVRHFDGSTGLSVKLVRDLRQFLIDTGVDIVHTHGFKSDVAAYFATMRLPIRRVSTTHGWCAGEGLRIRLYEAIGRVALRRFDRVYPVSAAQAEELEARWGFDAHRIRLLVNAVDTRMFDECFATRQARAIHAPFRVLFAGRLCRPKGLFDLVRAFAAARLDVDSRLLLAGEGPAQEAAARLAVSLGLNGRVQWVGGVNDIRPLMQQSDVVVLPSYSEGMPRILMESCAAGVPVIGSDIPGIRALIRDQQTGRLVRAGDVAGFAQALEDTARDPGTAHQMALNAHDFIVARHSAERLSRELEEEYRDLASDKSDPAPSRFQIKTAFGTDRS